MRYLMVITTVLLAGIGLNCAGASSQCLSSSACPENNVCVAGLCRSPSSVPVKPQAARLELFPESLAVVTSRRGTVTAPSVNFGRESDGNVVVLLRYSQTQWPRERLSAAFLVFEPMPGAPPGPGPVQLALARITSPWSGSTVSWQRLPSMSGIEARWLASTWGNRALRLDITDLLKSQSPNDNYGLAVLASPQNPVGASFALGTAGGRAPRLDLYLE